MNIYMLRHGETDWNQVGRLQGHTDIPLNQAGKEQINVAAETLIGLGIDIDLIYASPLARAHESAEIVADRLGYGKKNVIIEPLLVERSFGVGEGMTLSERTEQYPGRNYPGMESFEQLIERAHQVFQKIVTCNSGKENILLVAHGAILYAILTAITDGKMVYGGPLTKFEPGSVHLIRYTEDSIRIAKYRNEKEAFKDIK